VDTGTQETLHDASSFVAAIEKRTGLKVACPEENAFWEQWITTDQRAERAHQFRNSDYGDYLNRLLNQPAKHK
jgi:glucose-1-phosphate thymidylyltransferase